MEDREQVYNGNFADSEIAESWKIRNNKGCWGWRYHNNGGRDEDIYFIFDRVNCYREDSVTIAEEEQTIPFPSYILSPPINLTAGEEFEVDYEIRLFGIDFPGKTCLMLQKDEYVTTPDILHAIPLEEKSWPLDGFQWPVSTVRFTVEKSGKYRLVFFVENRVPVNLYWISIFHKKEH